MRNLKRVLSLALASAMLLGMMVMGAGAADKKAADLTDMDKINNKDAVSLMVDLGIITGKPDGSYAPAETVDRATMATLIYRVLEASSDTSAFTGVSSTLADVKGTWAEGAINYCSSLNIVNGDGTKFYPTNKVTVVQAAKMLLVSLGYDADLSKYSNDANWSVNIMKDAQKAGLMEGVDQKASAELTRDNAAQMIFNAMMAKTVEPDTERDQGVLYLKKYIPNATTLGYETYGLVKVTAKVDAISDGKAVLSDAKPALTGLAITGKIAASASAIGQTATVYVKATGADFTKDPITGTFKEIFTSEISGTTSNLLGSKVGATIAKMTDKTDKTNYVSALADKIADVTFYYNGDTIKQSANGAFADAAVGTVYYNTDAKAVLKVKTLNTAAADDTAVITAGVVVEFYGDSKADVVKVTEKTVKTVTGAVKTKTDDDGIVTVYVPGVVGTSTKYVAAKGYEELAKDDVVLIYTNSDVTYIEKAATVTGKVTGFNSDYKVKVDGAYYGKSALTGTKAANISDKDNQWDDFDNEYTFFLDNGKNVVSYTKNTDETSGTYALVLESKFIEGGTIGASNYMQAKLLFSDGTSEIVTVSKIGGLKVVKTVKDAKTEVKYEDLTAENGFYTYSTDTDGKYLLKTGVTDKLESKTDLVDDTAIKNKAQFITGNTTYVANNATVFVVAKTVGDTTTYSSYTGYSNVPGMTAASAVVLADKTSHIAKYVYLTTDAFTGDVADGFIFVVNPASFSYNSADKTFSFKTIGIDGTESSITVKSTDVITDKLGITKNDQGMIQIVTQDADGVVSEVKKITPAELTTLSDGVISNGTVYDYDSDTAFYVIDIDSDKAVTASEGNTIDLTDTAYEYHAAIIAKDGTATIVYIVRTPAAG